MKVKHISRLIMLVVYIIALIIGLLNSKNNILFLVLPCASFIWTILDVIYFTKKLSVFNKQIVSDFGNVLLYQLPNLLAVLFFKFEQPIIIKIKIFILVLIIVNLITVYLIDKKYYENSLNR